MQTSLAAADEIIIANGERAADRGASDPTATPFHQLTWPTPF